VPPLEAWKKVHITSEFFEKDPHGQFSCQKCHGGNPGGSDKESAHQGIVQFPSEEWETYCLECHSSDPVYNRFVNFDSNLHKTQEGYFERFRQRAGYDIRDDETLLHEFNNECGKCHATCGQCHIGRPISVGSGFLDGHLFKGAPETKNNCVACHGARVGAEYYNENEYTDADGNRVKGDVHLYSSLMAKCDFCHDGHEMHGDGTELDYRYDPDDAQAPRCEECHEDDASANNYHTMHWSGNAPKLSCQVCHSQPYKSCNSCHVGGEGITGSPYETLKIGKNYMKSDRYDSDYILVRHIPIAPDTYEAWGVDDLPNYESSEPTWKYATPHNIQLETAQTTVGEGEGCGSKCHGSDYYLRESDVQLYNDSDYVDREIEANRDVFMEME